MTLSEKSFGILIAFVIPGWVILLGLSLHLPTVDGWLTASHENQPAVGGFLFSMLASVTLGMLTSTIRWLILDQVFRRLLPANIGEPNFRELRDSNEGLQTLVEGHYRYYQFNANLLVASAAAAVLRWLAFDISIVEMVGAACLWVVVGLGARNAFDLYHKRVGQLFTTERTISSLIIPKTK